MTAADTHSGGGRGLALFPTLPRVRRSRGQLAPTNAILDRDPGAPPGGAEDRKSEMRRTPLVDTRPPPSPPVRAATRLAPHVDAAREGGNA